MAGLQDLSDRLPNEVRHHPFRIRSTKENKRRQVFRIAAKGFPESHEHARGFSKGRTEFTWPARARTRERVTWIIPGQPRFSDSLSPRVRLNQIIKEMRLA